MRNHYVLSLLTLLACRPAATIGSPSSLAGSSSATLAQVYYWRAKPGMLEAYNRYIKEVAEPIDAEAQRQDAFISVTTFATRDTASPWTHMRMFLLRDSAQLLGLPAALDAAGMRLEPDSARRRARSEHAATLRDRVGSSVLEIVK
jgi:hypothetical protein